MSGIRRTIGVDSIVGITVIGNDDSLVIVSLSSLNDLTHTVVNGPYSLSDSIIDTSVSHHITIGEVYHDEVILLCVDGTYQLVLHLVSTHFRLQVVGSHLRRGNQNTILALVWSLTTTIEEEGDMSVLLSLSGVELLLALL